jgi:hypothetical protein
MEEFRSCDGLQAQCTGSMPGFASGDRNPAGAADVASQDRRGSNIMRNIEGREVETGVEARAGFLDRPVLVVLVVSTVLAALAMGAIWLGFWKL